MHTDACVHHCPMKCVSDTFHANIKVKIPWAKMQSSPARPEGDNARNNVLPSVNSRELFLCACS